jgi:hypothetical protein
MLDGDALVYFTLFLRGQTNEDIMNVMVPNTKGWFSACLGYPSVASNLRGVVLVHLTLLSLRLPSPHISHGTDTIVTPYVLGLGWCCG